MASGFLAMQLAVARGCGDKQLHPLVRRLWSATRSVRHVPPDVREEIEDCVQELLALAQDPSDREERLRAASARIEDVFIAVALLVPGTPN
jgi:hypothetical protein